MKPVRFLDYDCSITFGRYSNGRLAIQLMTDEGPMATATVNVPEASLPENYVCIKDYSENEGMLSALIEAGVVEQATCRILSGHVQIPVCRLTDDAIDCAAAAELC